MTRDDPSQAPRGPSRALLLAALALLLVGAVGLVVDTLRAGEREVTLVARGEFWAAQDAFGSAKETRQSGTLALDRGEAVRFEPPETDGLRYERIHVVYQRLRDGSLLDVELRVVDGEGYVLRIAPASTFGVALFWRERDGTLKPLVAERERDLVGEPFQRLDVEVNIREERLLASVNGQLAIDGFPLERPGGEYGFVARGAGDLYVDGFAVVGRDGDEVFTRSEDLTGLSSVGFAHRLGQRLAVALLVLLYLALLLRAFCTSPPGLGRLVAAAGLALGPAAVALAVGVSYDAGPIVWFGLLALGLVPGFLALRGARLAPRRGGGLITVALILIGFGFAASQAWTYLSRVEEPIVKAEVAAREREAPAPHQDPRRVELGPHNSVTLDAPHRNIELETEVTLAEGSVFQVRMRAPNATWPEGISLFLSTHPGFASGFYRETRDALVRIGDAPDRLPAGAPLGLLIRAQGRAFVAQIDGAGEGGTTASAESAIFPEGSIVLLAAHGNAVLDGLELRVVAEPDAAGLSLSMPTLAALLCVLFGLVYTVALRLFVGIGLLQAAEIAALGLLPTAWFFSRLSPTASADLTQTWALIAALLVLFLPTMVFANRIKLLGFVALAALVLGGGALALKAAKPRVWPVDDESLSGLTITRWSGDRLSRDLLHLQHPLYRRWNLYLAQHELRGRRHEVEKPEGVIRIACVGSSSTLGRKVQRPYSMRLQERLRAAGHPVEVLNGGVSGSVSARLLPFLEEVLLRFDPDVVTLSLYFNDSFALTQSNDRPYVESITAPDHTRSSVEDFKMNVKATLGTQAFARLMESDPALAAEEEMFQGENAPPLLYAENLREFAELLTGRGIRLVFIKEPVAGDVDRLWRKEFYAAMEDVAAEFDIPIVDPSPTLQERGGAALFMDKVHPFDEGHEAVTEALYPTIEQVLRSLD